MRQPMENQIDKEKGYFERILYYFGYLGIFTFSLRLWNSKSTKSI